jgi:hypothetical protein
MNTMSDMQNRRKSIGEQAASPASGLVMNARAACHCLAGNECLGVRSRCRATTLQCLRAAAAAAAAVVIAIVIAESIIYNHFMNNSHRSKLACGATWSLKQMPPDGQGRVNIVLVANVWGWGFIKK